jgi:Flp pilus assembly protein TadG
MRSILNFLRDDRGSETVQFIVWLPLIAVLLVIVTDASFLYLYHTEMVNVARDTARRMTTSNLASKVEAEDYALAELSQFGKPYSVLADYNEATAMTVVISVPIRDIAVFGLLLEPVLSETMSARIKMRSEPT